MSLPENTHFKRGLRVIGYAVVCAVEVAIVDLADVSDSPIVGTAHLVGALDWHLDVC